LLRDVSYAFSTAFALFPQEHHQAAFALHLIGLGEKHDAAQWLEQSYRNGSLRSLGFSSDSILKSLQDADSTIPEFSGSFTF
jgi:hypothetical protein